MLKYARNTTILGGAMLALLCLPFLLNAQEIGASKMALVTLQGQTEIDASPSKVWAALTNAETAQSWCPYWQNANPTASLDTVGRSIAFKDAWGNGGKSVVLYAEKAKELRIAHVPADGSYLCQSKFTLRGNGSGTVVSVTEQYSDNLDVPLDRDTAKQMSDEIEKYMTALKNIVEG
jgi:uncharacterized protein YndB with AHSA1/START domain